MATRKKTPARKKNPTRAERSAAKQKRTAKASYEHRPARSEQEQIRGLSEDLRDAWERLRRTLVELGEQAEIRTSHRAIMFSRKTCYAFVRPKKKFLELTFFLRREQSGPLLKKVSAVAKTKFAHIVAIRHADELDPPLPEWLREAFSEAV